LPDFKHDDALNEKQMKEREELGSTQGSTEIEVGVFD
jgi:hypothetical protein